MAFEAIEARESDVLHVGSFQQTRKGNPCTECEKNLGTVAGEQTMNALSWWNPRNDNGYPLLQNCFGNGHSQTS